MTTASVVYHGEKLMNEYFEGNEWYRPLLSKAIFKNEYGIELSSIVEIAEGGSEGRGMKASGIPPHICLLNDCKKMKSIMEDMILERSIMEGGGEGGGVREGGVRGGGPMREVLKSMMKEVMKEVLEEERERIRGEGGEERRRVEGGGREREGEIRAVVHVNEGRLSGIPGGFKLPGGNLQNGWVGYF